MKNVAEKVLGIVVFAVSLALGPEPFRADESVPDYGRSRYTLSDLCGMKAAC